MANSCSPLKVKRVDISKEDLSILDAVQAYTMTSQERILAVIDAVRYVAKHNIPGAIVECGVWRGGSSMAAALALNCMATTDRDIFLFDTYEGMTEPTSKDMSYDNITAEEQLNSVARGEGVWCEASLDDVRRNLHSTGYPASQLKFVRGRVEDTIPAKAPDRIAVLRLDTDWYESTLHELIHLFPRLSSGGIVIVDDYGHWLGARQATDEYFERIGVPVFLNRIDYTGRIAVKP